VGGGVTSDLFEKGHAMPRIPHVEKHFTATETVRDIVIGMADGLTVPFALAAGLAAAVPSTALIGYGWLGRDRRRCNRHGAWRLSSCTNGRGTLRGRMEARDLEIDNLRDREVQEVNDIFKAHGLEGEGLKAAVSWRPRAAPPKPRSGGEAGGARSREAALRLRSNDSTALFAAECQSFLDNLVAQIRRNSADIISRGSALLRKAAFTGLLYPVEFSQVQHRIDATWVEPYRL
jgi:VIT family